MECVKEIQCGNVTIRIHRPTLTEEERKKREGLIISAMEQMAWEMQKGERKHGA